MKPEEFEVYVIPPNFMEGGTLFGGLLKTRNTIEAVILGFAVGVPVLHLPFSLTVRVVILCLTALPLVLLALIGVSGMSLSAFTSKVSLPLSGEMGCCVPSPKTACVDFGLPRQPNGCCWLMLPNGFQPT